MSQPVTIEPVRSVADQRGLVVEPMGADLLPQQRNAHLVLTEPGQVRGNHYHERGTEVTLVVGPALFRYRDGAIVHEVALAAGQAYRITIPPGIAHAFQNPGPGLLVLIGFNTEAHDRARPDVVRDILIEPGSAAIRPAAP
jgi:UDP-2-acetamido-2,6-beta-L-arabino-hexul-4-ose reductase